MRHHRWSSNHHGDAARHGNRRGIALNRATILGMAVLMLVMPVNYRAGSDADHPHAFFQGALDLLTGTPHTHQDETSNIAHIHEHPAANTLQPTATISPFLATDIPLEAAAQMVVSPSPLLSNAMPEGVGSRILLREAISRRSLSPDIPSLTDRTFSADQGSPIASLGLVVALFVVASIRRNLPSLFRQLAGFITCVESPPPRFVPCN